jgi:DNA-binding response OmpR family regulator
MILAQDSPVSNVDNLAPETAPPVSTLGILIVDDEAPIRSILTRYLSSRKFAVDGAEGADEGLQLIRIKRYGIALCDLRMKTSSGFDFLAGARKLDAGLPIVILSGASDAETMAQVTTAGASAFLSKPIGWAELMSAIFSARRLV